jgi:transglutaminase-like putative cysteine protease
MPRFEIHHITKYTYELPVRDSANQVILFPLKDEYQEVLKHELEITGEPNIDIYKDYYGNEVGCFMHANPHNQLVVDSKVAVITKIRPLPINANPSEDQWKLLEKLRHEVHFIDFLREPYFDGAEQMSDVIKQLHDTTLSPLAAMMKLNQFVFENFRYIQGITSVETTLNEIWKLKAGVCQDFAHILSSMLRNINVPARYVSGYICPNKNGMRGEGATHAWVEAYLPGYGWLGLDPTNNCFATDLYVRLAVGRNFTDCTPVKGTYKGTCNQTLEVGVTVSYENGNGFEEQPMFLSAQTDPVGIKNSYRKFLEIQQQQQQ